jgi:hypothetical protein
MIIHLQLASQAQARRIVSRVLAVCQTAITCHMYAARSTHAPLYVDSSSVLAFMRTLPYHSLPVYLICDLPINTSSATGTGPTTRLLVAPPLSPRGRLRAGVNSKQRAPRDSKLSR